MSTLAPAVSAEQILTAVLRESEGGQSPLLDSLRSEVLIRTREAYDALYRTEQLLPAPVLHALAAVTADWQGSGPLAQWHRAQGADPQIAAADPIRGEVHGLEAATVQALRDHVDLLSSSPALTTAEDHEPLVAAGVSPTVTVLISQLVSFESYLQRLLAGLAVLHGAALPSADAPGRTPASRGRRAGAAPLTVTGRTTPQRFTREMLQWEPWIPVPSEEELTEAQRASFAAKATTNSVYFRMLSLTPAITAARSTLDNAIFLPRDGLPKAERELAAAVASKVNDCIYCASVHARKAAGLSKRPEDVDRLLAADLDRDHDWIAADLTPLQTGQDQRWATQFEAAAELSRPRPAVTAEHVAALRTSGLDDTHITDLITAAAFFAWANRLMLSLGEPSIPTP